MPEKTNLRKEERLKYKNTIQYEENIGDELYATPVSTNTFDLATRGIGFYANKEFKLKSKLRISCAVSNSENISFVVSVVRLQFNKTDQIQYLVGAEIIEISDENKEKLRVFLQDINIFSLLGTLDLENVMDIHFMAGYPVILKRMGKLKTVGRVLDEFTI